MICIYCFHCKTNITNSRGHKKEASTWRRHACPNCGRMFSTHEAPVMADSYTVTDEASNTGMAYSRSRLSASLARAFAHVPAGAVYPAVDGLLGTIEDTIVANAYYGVLSKDELGMLVYETLKSYDPVAGLQYAAQNGLVSAVSQRKRGRPSLK